MTAPTWALLCASVCALLRLSSASKDDPIEQREVTFDIRQVMQQENQRPFFDMMQRPLDPLFDLSQREMDLSEILADFKEQPIGFSPRSSRPHLVHPVDEYPVQFPLARPSSQNIRSICLHGDHRPRYPESYFPASGFGVLKRQADAVNTLEAWYTTCCGQNQTEEALLCCATQAWEKSISHFCEVEFSIKAPHFHCCKRNSSERLPCFDKSAPNPEYNPTEVFPVLPLPPKAKFNFDPSSCSGMSVKPHSLKDGRKGKKKDKKVDAPVPGSLLFPPAEPNESNVESICRNRKWRPLYNVKCLKGSDYNLVALQAKTINTLEKSFKICCRNTGSEGQLSCAQLKWQEELKKFCTLCKQKRLAFPCCDGGLQSECFNNLSTDPGYNKTLTQSPSLSSLCDTHKSIMKKVSVGFRLKSVVDKCCRSRLSPTERSACIPQSLSELFEATCSSRESSSAAVKRCCRLSSAECFNKLLTDAITKATPRQKNKKICPVS